MRAEAECLKKTKGPGCKRCAERKVGCSLVGLQRKVERKEERRRVLSEPEADNVPMSLELVELVSQIAASMDLMERLVMGVDRIGKGLEVIAERMEKKKEKKDAEMQTEELTEDEGTERKRRKRRVRRKRWRREWKRPEKREERRRRKVKLEKSKIELKLYFLGMIFFFDFILLK